MQANQFAAGPLEDHLRNLILTNSDSDAAPHLPSSDKASLTGTGPGTGTLPSNNNNSHHQLKDDVGDGHTHPRPAPRGGRKRPNQAQRRQMNAELSIPIDTRTHFPASSRPPHPHHGHQRNPFHSSITPTHHPPNLQGQSQGQFSSNGGHVNKQPRRGQAQFAAPSAAHQSDWRRPQHDGLSRGVNVMRTDTFPPRNHHNPLHNQPTLYNPGSYRQAAFSPEQLASQSAFLDQLCCQIVKGAEIGLDEISEKENFRMYVESICRHVVTRHEQEVNYARDFQPESVQLKCFGSLASGFATKAADMDLGLLSPMSRLAPDSPESPIPRLIEEALLGAGFGARLLTKTRVPIIKLCEKPSVALRQGLLDARKKWEEGVDQDERELDDDEPDDTDVLQDTNLPIDSGLNQPSTEVSTPKPSLDKTPVSPHEESFTLKQSPNQSLAQYYGRAKRQLRHLKSRDATLSNYQDFTEADFILLDKVASAFVKGLHDAELRSRILAYPSFNVGDVSQLKNYRSLFGVNTMIEGEELVRLWEAKQSSSTDPHIHHEYESVIQRWKHLQHTQNFGANPVWFNKELQLAVEAIRQIPCVQIMQLRQDQHESPTQYQARTSKIAVSIPASSRPSMDSHIIQRYVDGIRNEKIRNEVRDFVTSTKTESLRTVARKHKAANLAAEFERAAEKGLYRPEDIPVLESYTAILRRQPVQSLKHPQGPEFLIPITNNEKSILDKVRLLADPATLGPNKPRDKYNDSLEFPKSGIGVQCDINFSAHLALQNTLLLRCYSSTDRRVRPLVLFVKHWAKARGINTPYRGTLSSYGYVLMVLHYLINVVEPFVCPNLQELAPPDPDLPPYALEGITTCQGHNVRFWRDERAIQSLAQQGQLNQNHDSLGTLLLGFFEYYAQGNMMATVPKKGFNWGRDVISLHTHGGLLTKVEKGWTGAKTVVQPQTGSSPTHPEVESSVTQFPSLNQPVSPDEGLSMRPGATEQHQQQQQTTPKPKEVKEIRHRYLFAIEDPFELDHNVARTVTHNGIVSIRDEFRRAWRIIRAAGNGHGHGRVDEDLLEDVKVHNAEVERRAFMALLDEIHGDEFFEV